MASPQARYQPQDYFSPPLAENRQRSSSAAARYSSQAYSNPPQPVPNQQLLAPHNYPLPPAGTSFRQEPPYPVEDPHAGSYMNTPIAQRPLAQQAMIHSRRHSNDIFPMEGYQDEGYRRPSYQGEDYRRPSYQGEDYRRSSFQDEGYRRPSYANSGYEQRRASHHSDRSHRSHHSHHHDRDSDDDDYEEDRHKHHHHERHRSKSQVDDLDAYRQRQKDRGENVSRSFGDSILAVMSPLKYLIEPRDKY